MVDSNLVPRHVAIIMDGNGRWAKERGLARVQGHKAGMEALREVVRHSQVLGVKYLTVYAFSTENWKRPADEVNGIFKLLVLYVASELKELHSNNVKVNILGDWSVIPIESKEAVLKALDTTKNNTGLVFNIALNYGGRAEIISGIKSLVKEKLSKGESLESLTEEEFSQYLYTKDMPDPEVIIRTGGEERVSNFLLWQGAYSELVVRNVYWPDFTNEEYDMAIEEYQKRDRRFGGVK